MPFELRLNDKEPDTQTPCEESSKQREQQKPETEAGTSPVQTKDRRKASIEEECGQGKGSLRERQGPAGFHSCSSASPVSCPKKKKNQLKWLCDLEINKFSKTLPVYINILNKDMELNSGQAHNLCSIKFVEWTPCKSDFNCIHSESELAHKTLD